MRLTRIAVATLLIIAVSIPALAGTTVVRKAFGTGVTDREPVGVAETFPADVGKVYFFNQLTDIGDPTTVHHVWLFNGQEMANVTLNVKGTSWRTWSSKNVMPYLLGEWKVEIRDAGGKVLDSATFTVGQ